MAKKNKEFWESASLNNYTFRQYYNRLTELAISRFEWSGLPDSVDARFLELTLFAQGQCVFFYDDVLGYLALMCTIGGELNVYRIPTKRRAYANNGYNKELSINDSVIIYNNTLRTGLIPDITMYATRLYNLERAIDVNANAQKTPIMILCDNAQYLTMKNMYMKYDGNQPFIFADKQFNPRDSITTLNTGAPYVADRLYTLKTQVWNEALTYLGISNLNIQKKERLITDEVQRNTGGIVASRFSALSARQQACNEINRMFGLDVWCEFKKDYVQLSNEDIDPDKEVTAINE